MQKSRAHSLMDQYGPVISNTKKKFRAEKNFFF